MSSGVPWWAIVLSGAIGALGAVIAQIISGWLQGRRDDKRLAFELEKHEAEREKWSRELSYKRAEINAEQRRALYVEYLELASTQVKEITQRAYAGYLRPRPEKTGEQLTESERRSADQLRELRSLTQQAHQLPATAALFASRHVQEAARSLGDEVIALSVAFKQMQSGRERDWEDRMDKMRAALRALESAMSDDLSGHNV